MPSMGHMGGHMTVHIVTGWERVDVDHLYFPST